MSLCDICKSIPFRKIIEGDETLPGAPARGSSENYYNFRFHDSTTQLFVSSNRCELCDVIAQSLKGSYWHRNMMKDEDVSRPVWLRFRFGNEAPGISIYLGRNLPETFVFGNYIWIVVTLDDPLAKIIRQRHVQESPFHDNALKQIDLWLNECFDTHRQFCHVAKHEMRLPTRVLDLDALHSQEAMMANRSWHDLFRGTKCKLVESAAQERGYYVALSYCWGKSLAFKTTKDNRRAHMKGVNVADLPKSLQDAIFITRYLSMRYIWIDCLCIIQDDKIDWQREAASMADVYSNAYVTIAAARADHSGAGFLGPRNKSGIMGQASIQDSEGSFKLHFRVEDVSASPGSIETASLEPLRNEPLSTRVWTLQERLLAPRTLHFATEQMYWECSQMSKGEDGSNFGSGDEDFRLHDIAEGLKDVGKNPFRWYKLVEAYTSRNITYQSDKLPALSGVIDAIQRQINDICYAGIWKSQFIEGLLWRLEDPDLDLYVMAPKQPERPQSWRAPSWSFAAVEGVIRYEWRGLSSYCAKLIECSVTPNGANPLGEIKTAFARIQGPVTTIRNIGKERTSEGSDCELLLQDDSFVRAKVFYDFERHEHAVVLMLMPDTGLAIEPVDIARHVYVRIGVVKRWRNPGSPPVATSQYPEPVSITLL